MPKTIAEIVVTVAGIKLVLQATLPDETEVADISAAAADRAETLAFQKAALRTFEREPEAVKIEEPASSLPVPVSAPVSPIADIPAKSPSADHTKRIKEYKQDHLRNGNMRPAKGLGIEAKFNKYVASRVGKQFASTLTAEEWASVLDELDAVRAKDGDAGVVTVIEQAIAMEVKI